jgi:hypothetical protein
MRFVSGLFARPLRLLRGRLAATRLPAARRLEAAGRTEQAFAEYLALGAEEDALRVALLGAELAEQPEQRLRFLTQAEGLASGEQAQSIRLRRVRLCIDLVKGGSLRLLSRELRELGETCQELGASELAAEAFALSGDRDAQADALVRAGSVEQLEDMLTSEAERARNERRTAERLRQVEDLVSTGSRREALALCSSPAAELSAVSRRLMLTRLMGPRAHIVIDGVALDVVFGTRVTIGRTATLSVAAPSLSREHLVIERTPRGIEVRDLGSRNGTRIAGVPIRDALPLTAPVTLELARDVSVVVEPWTTGAKLNIAGQMCLAPFGALAAGPWQLEAAPDGWIELVSRPEQPSYLGRIRADTRIQLCFGDLVCDTPGVGARIRVPVP